MCIVVRGTKAKTLEHCIKSAENTGKTLKLFEIPMGYCLDDFYTMAISYLKLLGSTIGGLVNECPSRFNLQGKPVVHGWQSFFEKKAFELIDISSGIAYILAIM